VFQQEAKVHEALLRHLFRLYKCLILLEWMLFRFPPPPPFSCRNSMRYDTELRMVLTLNSISATS
jgi:hypothetical protein